MNRRAASRGMLLPEASRSHRAARILRRLVLAATLLEVLLTMSPLSALAGKRPDTLGLHDSSLSGCPGSPNCVSSEADDAPHRVEPFRIRSDANRAWRALREIVESLPRTEIVSSTEDYIHAECRSRLFRFVDDIEFHLRASEGLIRVRSASRVGYSDLGVNRGRVEDLRSRLRKHAVVD